MEPSERQRFLDAEADYDRAKATISIERAVDDFLKGVKKTKNLDPVFIKAQGMKRLLALHASGKTLSNDDVRWALTDEAGKLRLGASNLGKLKTLLTQLGNHANMSPNEVIRTNAELNKILAQSKYGGKLQGLKTTFYTGLLGHTKTFTTNLLGQGLSTGLEETSRLFATPFDAIRAKATNTPRTLFVPGRKADEVEAVLNAAFPTLREEVTNIAYDLKNDTNTTSLSEYAGLKDQNSIVAESAHPLARFFRTGMRLGLNTPDRLAYMYEARRTFGDYLQGYYLKHGRLPESEDLDGFKAMAVAAANFSTFRNSTVGGKLAQAVHDLPGGILLAPLVRVVSAAAARGLDYTPGFRFLHMGAGALARKAGGPGEAGEQLAHLKQTGEQYWMRTLGRQLVGAGGIALGGALYGMGIITVQNPWGQKKTAEQKQLDKLTGIPEDTALSINLNGLTRVLLTADPTQGQARPGDVFQGLDYIPGLNAMMVAGAEGVRTLQGQQDFGTGLSHVLTMPLAAESRYGTMSTINRLLNYTDTTGQASPGWGLVDQMVNTGANALVPRMLADAAAVIDPLASSKGMDEYQRMGRRLTDRVPFLRGAAAPKDVDFYGRPINQRPKTPNDVLRTFLVPGMQSQATDDTAVMRLMQLQQKTGMKNHIPKVFRNDRITKTTFNADTDGYQDMDDAEPGSQIAVKERQALAYREAVGQATHTEHAKLFADPAFNALSDVSQVRVLAKVNGDIRKNFEIQMLGEPQRHVNRYSGRVSKPGKAFLAQQNDSYDMVVQQYIQREMKADQLQNDVNQRTIEINNQ